MHWLKLLAEVWLLFGIVITVVGVVWTSRMSRQAQQLPTVVPSAPPRRPEFASQNLTKLSA